jgi:hypothetical protein
MLENTEVYSEMLESTEVYSEKLESTEVYSEMLEYRSRSIQWNVRVPKSKYVVKC